jgi:N-methylhydantoinase B/oxoprolinase/acetone carboxylase alpha subunit
MSVQREVTELEAIRHDLKNVMTAFRSGCRLIGSMLEKSEHRAIHEFLTEMIEAADDGTSLIQRLGQLQTLDGQSD